MKNEYKYDFRLWIYSRFCVGRSDGEVIMINKDWWWFTTLFIYVIAIQQSQISPNSWLTIIFAVCGLISATMSLYYILKGDTIPGLEE